MPVTSKWNELRRFPATGAKGEALMIIAYEKDRPAEFHALREGTKSPNISYRLSDGRDLTTQDNVTFIITETGEEIRAD